MCFKVVLFTLIFHQYLSDGNQHLDRPCRSITGSSGYCVRLELCPILNRLLNSDNFESKNNVTKSMCGYDTDKTWLYCCDKDEINLNNAEKIKPAIIQDFSQSTTNKNATDFQPTYCTTPNGVKALCVSIYNCPTLLFAIPQNNETIRNFLRESKCGYESGSFFVCCGTATSFAKTVEDDDNINFPTNHLIPKDNCGLSIIKNSSNNNGTVRVDLRIFGGVNAEIGEFPWMALLEYELILTGQKMFRCSGSLISSKYLLTAAHCVIPTPGIKLINIRLGEWDYSNEGPTTACTRINNNNNNKSKICVNEAFNVQHESLHPHPGYKIGQKEKFNDIALIRLNENINFSNHNNIRPICLPDPEEILIPGERLTISGWGLKNYNEQSTVKQKVEVPIIPISQCSIMFEQNNQTSNREFSLGRGQFCAGGESGKDACIGDSGTPLMKLKEGVAPKWYIEGIVSYGLGCAAKDYYGIYSKVSKYIGWIHRTIVP